MLIERSVVCADCKQPLEETATVAVEARAPCLRCGSRARAVHIVTAGFIRSLDDLELDFRSDATIGPEAQAVPSRLVIVQREISPDRNLYVEHVEEESTGRVLWHVESTLTEFARQER